MRSVASRQDGCEGVGSAVADGVVVRDDGSNVGAAVGAAEGIGTAGCADDKLARRRRTAVKRRRKLVIVELLHKNEIQCGPEVARGGARARYSRCTCDAGACTRKCRCTSKAGLRFGFRRLLFPSVEMLLMYDKAQLQCPDHSPMPPPSPRTSCSSIASH